MRITRVILKNYRCFENHTVLLKDVTLIIGPNNAGKSTVIEALRLVAHVLRRGRNLRFAQRPDWVPLPWTTKGVTPAARGLDLFTRSVCFELGDPPAEIVAYFGNSARIHVYVHPDGDVFATIHGRDGAPVNSNAAAKALGLPVVRILPRIGPVLIDEPVRDWDYVAEQADTQRAPRLFRNQLHRYAEHYEEFRKMAEDTWPGLEVYDFQRTEDNLWFLSIRDGTFVGELGWMGSGLQLWLQVIWFLASCEETDIVVLDEPDIYMHADLQTKLVDLVRHHYDQVIVATHSTSMVAAVDPENLLFVDRTAARSRTADTLAEVDALFSEIGPGHNMQIARLLAATKCLLVEGKDLDVLSPIHATLFPSSRAPFSRVPSWPIHGWNGWELQSIWAKEFRQANRRIRVYCLLDRDFHTAEEIEARLQEAISRCVDLHVWEHKELENYLLVPSAIVRLLKRSAKKNQSELTELMVQQTLDATTEDMYDSTVAKHADAIHRRQPGLEPSSALAQAQQLLQPLWSDPAERRRVVHGKNALKQLSAWAQDRYCAGITATSIARSLHADEIDGELKEVLTAIERGNRLT